MSLNYEAEFYRNGLHKTIQVKEYEYDVVEFTINSKLVDEQTGKVVLDSGHTSLFSHREFVEFFAPFVNDMKVKIENESVNH